MTQCARGIYVRVPGYHCRLCYSTISNDIEYEYSETDSDETDEGFHEADSYSPEVEPHIVSLLVTIIFI